MISKNAIHILIGTFAENRYAALLPNEPNQLYDYYRYIFYILRYILEDIF